MAIRHLCGVRGRTDRAIPVDEPMSVQCKRTPYKPVRIHALLPVRSPTDAAHDVVANAVDVDTRVTNGLLGDPPSSLDMLTTWTSAVTAAPQGTSTDSTCARQTAA
jgi:hypothetical protein